MKETPLKVFRACVFFGMSDALSKDLCRIFPGLIRLDEDSLGTRLLPSVTMCFMVGGVASPNCVFLELRLLSGSSQTHIISG